MRFMSIISFGITKIFPKLIISRVKIIKFPFKNFFFFYNEKSLSVRSKLYYGDFKIND